MLTKASFRYICKVIFDANLKMIMRCCGVRPQASIRVYRKEGVITTTHDQCVVNGTGRVAFARLLTGHRGGVHGGLPI